MTPEQALSNYHQREVQLKKALEELAAEKTLREQAQRERDSLQVQRGQVLHLLSGGMLTEQQVQESGLGHGVLAEQNHHEYMRTKAEAERDKLKARLASIENANNVGPIFEQLEKSQRERDEARSDADMLRRELVSHREKSQGNYWAWQGDGEDHLESLVYNCPVVIHAHDLKAIIKVRDEALHEDELLRGEIALLRLEIEGLAKERDELLKWKQKHEQV